MKKSLVAGAIITALGASLVGCGNGDTATPTTTNEINVTTKQETEKEEVKVESQTGDVKKPDKIRLMYATGFLPEDGTKQWEEAYEKGTGVDIELQYVSVNEYNQKVDLAFASGDAPEVFNAGIPTYAVQGALADLTELVKSSEAMKSVEQSVWDSIAVGGKYYGVPLERGNGTVTYMRKDWLDKLGLEVPTTYEEYLNVLRAFKTIQPDAIPFTAAGVVDEFYLRDFYHDARPGFMIKDGEWIDGMIQPEMEEALIRMRDAYADGLIDMEVVTNKTSTCRDRWYAGQVGAFTYWAGNWNVSLEDRLKEVMPEAEVIALPALEGVEYFERVPSTFVISSTTKNVEGVFKYFMEYMYDGGEGSLLFQHGAENVHWERQGENIVHLPKISKPEELIEKALITPVLSFGEITEPNSNYKLDDRIENSLEIFRADAINLPAQPASKTLSKINSDLTALREKTITGVVLGKYEVKEALDVYKKEATNLGIDKVLEEFNSNK